eukprot:6181672-Pleurochrysis_carterae.AAC.2
MERLGGRQTVRLRTPHPRAVVRHLGLSHRPAPCLETGPIIGALKCSRRPWRARGAIRAALQSRRHQCPRTWPAAQHTTMRGALENEPVCAQLVSYADKIRGRQHARQETDERPLSAGEARRA